MDEDNIQFITLRIRSPKLIQDALAIPDKEWERVYLPIPKRKHKHVKVHQSQARGTRSIQPSDVHPA